MLAWSSASKTYAHSPPSHSPQLASKASSSVVHSNQSVVVMVPRRDASSSPAYAKLARLEVGEPERGTYVSSDTFAKS